MIFPMFNKNREAELLKENIEATKVIASEKEETKPMSYEIMIDDTIKTVWCPEELTEWHKSFNGDTGLMIFSLASTGVKYSDLVDNNGNVVEPEIWCGKHSREVSRKELMDAIHNGYSFETYNEDSCKKYMWVKQFKYTEQNEAFLGGVSKRVLVERYGIGGVYYTLTGLPEGNRYMGLERHGFTKDEAVEILGEAIFMYNKFELPEGVR